ncbi:hypothetical protein HispidOSU_003070 [Sigmodon hispidus]
MGGAPTVHRHSQLAVYEDKASTTNVKEPRERTGEAGHGFVPRLHFPCLTWTHTPWASAFRPPVDVLLVEAKREQAAKVRLPAKRTGQRRLEHVWEGGELWGSPRV